MKKALLTAFVGVGLIAAAQPGLGYARPGRTFRITAAGAGWDVFQGVLSGDGGTVAMVTVSPIAEDDTNGDRDIYVRDLEEETWERVTVGHGGQQSNGHSQDVDLSHDGRFVFYESDANNHIPNDANDRIWDIYVRDRATGTTSLVSRSNSGAQNDANALDPDASADGRFVAFVSGAKNLEADDNLAGDVFVRDLVTGTTERVTVASDGSPMRLVSAQYPAISGDGRHVAYSVRYPIAADDTNASDDIYVFDRLTRTAERVSVGSDGGEGNGNALFPVLSHDGRFVAFASSASNLVPNDINGFVDTFVRDRHAGVTERVSVSSEGREPNGVVSVPAISSDGRWVTGNSLATNFGHPDDNGNTDIYVHDRLGGTMELVSRTAQGATGNSLSAYPSMSADGRRILIHGEASDLEGAEGTGGEHLFIRDLGPALGIGELTATREGPQIGIGGWARAESQIFSSTADPATDAGAAARSAGAELTGVSLTARPEEEDILVAFDVAPSARLWPPLVGTSYQRPGAIAFVLELVIGGVRHEVRASGTVGVEGARFALFRCAPGCAKIADLEGGIGTASDGALVSVPLGEVGNPEILELLRAYAAGFEESTGASRILDEIALPGGTAVPARATVELAVVEPGIPAHQVAFTDSVPLVEGRFEGSLTVPSGPGAYDVWARACVATRCAGARHVPVTP